VDVVAVLVGVAVVGVVVAVVVAVDVSEVSTVVDVSVTELFNKLERLTSSVQFTCNLPA